MYSVLYFSKHEYKYMSRVLQTKCPGKFLSLPFVDIFGLMLSGHQCEASLLSSACCFPRTNLCHVKHENYVCGDCITPVALSSVLFCSAAVWRFKDLGLVLRNMLTILPKSDRRCHQICKHRGMLKLMHTHTHTCTHTSCRNYMLFLLCFFKKSFHISGMYCMSYVAASVCMFLFVPSL